MSDRMGGRSRWASFGMATLFVLSCEAVGVLGALTTATGDSPWYDSLDKPLFNPPNWVFGPVWTVLYALMGLAAYLVWRRGREQRDVRKALALFGAQLVLNGIWTPIFFGAESVMGGAVVILSLWVVLAFTVRAFFRVSRRAGWLLVPYLLWVSYAVALNLSIWVLN